MGSQFSLQQFATGILRQGFGKDHALGHLERGHVLVACGLAGHEGERGLRAVRRDVSAAPKLVGEAAVPAPRLPPVDHVPVRARRAAGAPEDAAEMEDLLGESLTLWMLMCGAIILLGTALASGLVKGLVKRPGQQPGARS